MLLCLCRLGDVLGSSTLGTICSRQSELSVQLARTSGCLERSACQFSELFGMGNSFLFGCPCFIETARRQPAGGALEDGQHSLLCASPGSSSFCFVKPREFCFVRTTPTRRCPLPARGCVAGHTIVRVAYGVVGRLTHDAAALVRGGVPGLVLVPFVETCACRAFPWVSC